MDAILDFYENKVGPKIGARVVAQVSGDAETWLSLWDEKGIQMPPNAAVPPVVL